MSGKRVTDRQVRRYMDSRKDGHSQAAAAARAGFSERTGRRIDGAPVLPSQRDRTRRYRTRQDPFAEVWRAELVPMLAAMPSLRATTLLEELQRRHPARYPDRIRLTWRSVTRLPDIQCSPRDRGGNIDHLSLSEPQPANVVVVKRPP